MKYDIVVVGGGVIGLACAWRLAQAGPQVGLFERGLPGREASWAAAGMLAPQCEAAHYPPTDDLRISERQQAVFRAGIESRAMFPALAEELLGATGIDVELSLRAAASDDWRTPGVLYLVKDSDCAAGELLQNQVDDGHSVEAGASAAVDLGPLVRRDLPRHWLEEPGRALWLAHEGQVDNRKLVRALYAAARDAGVAMHSCETVTSFDIAGGRLRGLRTSQNDVACGQVLLCTGAWSGHHEGLPPECTPPVRPVAGAMLSLHQWQGNVRSIIYSYGLYMVPRRDGRLLVGSTMDEVGFDKQLRTKSVHHLISGACELLPSIADAAIDAQWVGLRPGSPDGLPVLGRTPVDNLFLGTGHFRNGILLTPITAHLMTECLLHNVEPPAAFSLQRFGQHAPHEASYAH